ncbi:MAG: hypothetical protein HY866_20330, partial [Chloroflexi bacterium]|nr:hypothetical protein [Chloroflexota bacterium]
MKRISPLVFLAVSITLGAALLTLWITGPAAGDGLAQTDPTVQQATVDSAIQTLFAQTQTAPLNMTQTIEAAFAAAQTATAAPVDATEPVQIQPVSVDTIEVAEVIELPLYAAPARTAAYLAPDGSRFAYLKGQSLCILDIATIADYVQAQLDAGILFENALADLTDNPESFEAASCALLDDSRMKVEQETIRWSPDSRYLVMSENFFRYYVDSDIWVLDTNSMTLADITDDGGAKFDITAPANQSPPIDVVPRWMPDGRIVFLRYTGEGEEFESPHIYTIRPDGSDLQQAGQLQTTQRFAVYALAVSADGKLAYNLWGNDSQFQSLNGVWISNLDGSQPEQLWHNAEEPNYVPMAVDWSPDGRYVAFNLPPTSFGAQYAPEISVERAIRISDKQEVLFSPDSFVWSAGWSGDGSAFVYTTRDILDPTKEGLYIAPEPGTPGRLLIQSGKDGEMATTLMGTTSLQT